MIKVVFTVFAKEVVDNFRDRRTLASALLMGPLFGPILFAFVINLSIERSLSDVEKTLEVPVIGAEHAPNLIRYLESRNLKIIAGPETREAALAGVKSGLQDIVVLIPGSYGEQLAESMPAKVELISDQANTTADPAPAMMKSYAGTSWFIMFHR